MNQKEVVHRYYVLGSTTADKILQVINHLTMEGLTKLKDSRFPLAGEQNLYKLMNRSDPLTSVFLNEKVDLNKLKEGLEGQGIPFAFKETSEGTNLYFRVKDQELAKKGLEKIVSDLKTNPKKYMKKPNQMTFEEKVAYVKQSQHYKGTITPQPQQTKERGI